MKINQGGIIGEVLETGGSLVKHTAKSIVKTPTDLAKAAGSQIGAKSQGQGENSGVKADQNQDVASSDQQTKEVVDYLYGAKKPQGQQAAQSNQNPQQQSPVNQALGITKKPEEKSPEETQKLQKLRQELHQTTYYQPLTNPKNQEEERPAEKVEREKKQKMQEEFQKEQKKPPPLSVKRARERVERLRGVSG